MREKFAKRDNCISDNCCIPRLYEKPLQFKNKKTNKPI